MSASCFACLEPLAGAERYHLRCIRELFGTDEVPGIDVELAKLHTLGLAMVGHTSLSGVQRKISLRLTGSPRTLQVAAADASYILKPQTQTFPSLPENEHVTMRVAALAGIEIPPCALIELTDHSLAYIVKRFDRTAAGKLLQEDFCQLAVKPPKDKYTGSAELCAKLVLRYASAPLVEAQKLFRLLVVTWWTGNGDMHLKNFSLLRGADARHRMSPAYDLVCTRLVIPDDTLALPIGGKKGDIGRRGWMELAARCQLPERAATSVLREVGDATGPAAVRVARSALPGAMKAAYTALLEARGDVLRRAAQPT